MAERGVNVIRMGNPSRVSSLLLEHTLDARVIAHPSYSKMRAMRQTADQHRNTASELAGKNVRDFGFEGRQQRRLLREEAKMLFQAADDLERFMTENVFASVQVITSTLIGASNRNICHLTFEAVFIDEAAQALESGCWILTAKGQRLIGGIATVQLLGVTSNPGRLIAVRAPTFTYHVSVTQQHEKTRSNWNGTSKTGRVVCNRGVDQLSMGSRSNAALRRGSGLA